MSADHCTQNVPVRADVVSVTTSEKAGPVVVVICTSELAYCMERAPTTLPENPEKPENPDLPDVPDPPLNPENPETPDHPLTPDHPDVPDQPEVPDAPGLAAL